MGNQAASSYADQVPVVPNTNLAVCLMVEPSPFTYVSGYATRFQEMLRYLDEQGDRVEIITTDQISSTKPDRYLRFPVHHTWGLVLPWYRELSLSIDVRFKGFRVIHRLKPDILHVSSP
jgi:sulfoquinovosyltransferase